MNIISTIAMILVLIGGLAWGLIGLGDFNLVAAIFDPFGMARIIYSLVGLSAVWLIVMSAMKYNDGSK